MSGGNDQGKSRLDRIEEPIERHERANRAAHENFEDEHKRLLTAQILMNGAMQKMLEVVAKNEAKADRFDERMIVLESKMEETTDKLNALISTVDGMIRKTT